MSFIQPAGKCKTFMASLDMESKPVTPWHRGDSAGQNTAVELPI